MGESLMHTKKEKTVKPSDTVECLVFTDVVWMLVLCKMLRNYHR